MSVRSLQIRDVRQQFAAKQRTALLAAIRGDTVTQLQMRIEGLAAAGIADHAIAAELQLPVDMVRRTLGNARAR